MVDLNIGGKNQKIYNWNIQETLIYISENYAKRDCSIFYNY